MATGYRIRLTAEQQAEWHRRWWAAGTAPAERERLEMVRLSGHTTRCRGSPRTWGATSRRCGGSSRDSWPRASPGWPTGPARGARRR